MIKDNITFESAIFNIPIAILIIQQTRYRKGLCSLNLFPICLSLLALVRGGQSRPRLSISTLALRKLLVPENIIQVLKQTHYVGLALGLRLPVCRLSIFFYGTFLLQLQKKLSMLALFSLIIDNFVLFIIINAMFPCFFQIFNLCFYLFLD